MLHQGFGKLTQKSVCQPPVKCRNSVYVFIEICNQRSKWFGSKFINGQNCLKIDFIKTNFTKSILEIGFDEINLEMIPPYVWINQYSIGFILLWLWNNWEKSYWRWRLYHITRSSKEDRNCYQGCVPGWWSEGIGNSRWHNCSNSLL